MHGQSNPDLGSSTTPKGRTKIIYQSPQDNHVKVHITFFKDEYAKSLTTEELTLPELAERVMNASARKKMKLPYLKLAKFGKKRTDANCLRHDANVEAVTGIEIDYDFEKVTFVDAVKAVRALRINALLYTSPTHTPERPRWRILAPTSTLCPPERRETLVRQLNGFLKAFLSVEKLAKSESFALSQSYFFGWVCDKPNTDHSVTVTTGSYIDQHPGDLAVFEASGGPATEDDGTEGAGKKTDTGNVDWATVEKYKGWLTSVADLHPNGFSAKGRMIIGHSGNLKDLNFDLDQAGLLPKDKASGKSKPYPSWSEVSLALTAIFKHDGRYTNEQIAAALMADLVCNQHVRRQKKNDRRAIERLIARAHAPTPGVKPPGVPDWREQTKDGLPITSMHNARLAIMALDIECKLDVFHNKLMFGYRDNAVHVLGDEVCDNAIIALRQLASDRFGFDLTDKFARDAIISLALQHCYDPVCDMLAGAEAAWDGVARLDRMAAEHLNCEDTKLNAAFMRKTMIAAVARARVPGIKKDEITVLEADEGYNKSTAWRVLAGDENFSDEKIIGKESREVQEQLADVWIHESADLSGLKKAEVETVKAYASRQEDNARPAYGHFLKRQKRRSIEVGTTNSDRYLQSQTGNRRFWTLRVLKAIDIEKLKRDRLQLWGEAAHYQSQGESLVLPEELWAEAGKQQERRRVTDPWEDVLRIMPEQVTYSYWQNGVQHEGARTIIHHERGEHRVSAQELLTFVLNVQPGNQQVGHNMRLATVMRHLEWQRHSHGGVKINGNWVKGYYRKA